MVHIFLIFFVLLNCIAPIYGSEHNKKLIIFTVNVGSLTSGSLNYCNKKYIDLIRKEYGVECKDNDPFIAVSEYRSVDQRTETFEYRKSTLKLLETFDQAIYNQQTAILETDFLDLNSECSSISRISQKLKEVTLLPFNLFYYRDSNKLTFKKEDSVLLSFKKNIKNIEYEFEIRLKTDFDNYNPRNFLNNFKKSPNWLCGGSNGDNQKPGFIDEFFNNGILAKKGEDIVHGPKGYFATSLCASENIPEIVLELESSRLTAGSFIYSGQKNRESCASFGIESRNNEIFCQSFYGPRTIKYLKQELSEKYNSLPSDDLDAIADLFGGIKEVPYSCLMNGDRFKQGETVVSSSTITINNNKYQVIVKMPNDGQEEVEIDNLLNNFTTKVNYHHEDKEKLLNAGIIEEKDGKFFHGPKGYFEYKLPEQPIIKESPSSFFSLKNFIFCCAGLTGLVIISVIYLRSINPC